MTAPFRWSAGLYASKGRAKYGARRTTAHALNEGSKRTCGRVLGKVRRCGEVRRYHPVIDDRTVSFPRPADIPLDNCQQHPGKGKDRLPSDLPRNRNAPAAAENVYGSFPGGAGARCRPKSHQQTTPNFSLTGLTVDAFAVDSRPRRFGSVGE
jgi:hypothetical protein